MKLTMNDRLYKAIHDGDYQTVLKLLEGGVSPNERDEDDTALSWAVHFEHEEIVKLLIDWGADPNQEILSGTVLHDAAAFRSNEIVQYLIAHGAIVNWSKRNGETPMLVLCRSGSDRIDNLRTLIEAGADLNASGEYGQTPLHYAALHAKPDFIQLMLDHGADVNALDNDDLSPLHFAVRQKYYLSRPYTLAVMDVLINYGAHIEPPAESSCMSVLELACKENNKEAVIKLLDRGADPNALICIHTAIETAVRSNRLEIVKILIERGADIDDNPLRHAIKCNHHEIFKLLLAYKPEMTVENILAAKSLQDTYIFDLICNYIFCTRNENNLKALLVAMIQSGDYYRFKQIVNTGIPLNFRDENYETLLLLAVRNKQYLFGQYLLGLGADIHDKAEREDSALMTAIRAKDILFIKLFEQHGLINRNTCASYKQSDPFYLSIYQGSVEILEVFLRHGYNIHAKDKYYENAVNNVISHGYTEMLRRLLELGLDPDFRFTDRPCSILEWAIANYKYAAIQLLLQYGATLQFQGRRRFPLIKVIMNSLTEIALLLLEYRAKVIHPGNGDNSKQNEEKREGVPDEMIDVNAADKRGRTPLLCAAKTRDYRVIEKLLQCGADPYLFNKHGESPNRSAMEKQDIRMINLFRKYCGDSQESHPH